MDEEPARPTTSPYLLATRPTSNGRVLLAHGFQHYCALHWGLSGWEIAAAFGEGDDEHARERVGMGASLLGGVLARGLVRAWARPFGGGEPVELRATVWELDDFAARFCTSAIDPKKPFDAAASTHWIFVDLDEWNAVVEASVVDVVQIPRRAVQSRRGATPVESKAEPSAGATYHEDRLVRLPEVKHRTGLTRSAIYRKMDAGRFPQRVSLSENSVAWRESELVEWIAQPS